MNIRCISRGTERILCEEGVIIDENDILQTMVII